MDIVNATTNATQLILQNPNAGLANWVGSNYFAIMIIMAALLIILLLPATAGFKRIFNWIGDNLIKPKKGYIRIKQILPNGRIRSFDVIPTGKMITFKTYEGKTITMPWKQEEQYIAYENNMLTIMIDSYNQQISIRKSGQTYGMSQEEFTDGMKFAYETGKIMGSSDLTGMFKQMMMMMALILAGGLLIIGFLSFSGNSKISKLDMTVKNLHIPNGEDIYNGFLNATQRAMAGSLNQSNNLGGGISLVPIVG